MLRKHGQILLSMLYANDLIIVIMSWSLAYYLRFYSGFFSTEYEYITPFVFYLYMVPFIIVIWPVVFSIAKLYLPKRYTSLWEEFFIIFKAHTMALFMLTFVSFFFYQGRIYYSRMAVFIFFVLGLFFLMLSRVIVRKIVRLIRKKGYNLKNVLIVGAGGLGRRVVSKMAENPWSGFNVAGWIDDNKEIGEEIDGKKVLGNVTHIHKCIAERNIDQVFIALPVRAYNRLLYLLKKLEQETVDVRVIPNIYQAVTLNASIEDFDGLPIINLTESPIYGWNQAIKRLFDIVVSLFVIVITAPIMLSVLLLVKLTSSGPVFFKQKRYGIGGKKFNVYKIRSMYTHDKRTADTAQATRNDPRITPIGRFIRRTSIDELPQFFNVLKGNMSVVGPRPHPLHLDDKHKLLLETYMWRYKVKPGITGWAQINGWRGETDTLEKMQRRIEHDIYYIEHWSIWFDFKIMWLTVLKGLINKNAY
ncbi:undecaprenyl-phosphate glucose phosphotransferase [Candidatus Woesebacteria bacterium RIFCSPLOWO2_01_FULL_39_25]|uniref:Undecaprenyl-phosphate glucose phosphotransferase n=1 Tax=Candidatus Woesebacteria bacterium RIFCSPLOWO2_01_FULL_39_25 TaxID=1802521 RepID=A0A1F8BN97_9BACT|nr:MAG: undecaprenyl-phosphate glucose phosphotransferase [Candidatus Woesebacteria bacterium RIFCSPLOWO2_01_FULL_39_25]